MGFVFQPGSVRPLHVKGKSRPIDVNTVGKKQLLELQRTFLGPFYCVVVIVFFTADKLTNGGDASVIGERVFA